ncbi:MAG TPA: DNA-binding protein [Blastocatellia bacterium]|jgi:predicted DNA-binding protein|nr:DNA-binding protein [Blastocatellia bacterium]
MKTIQVNLPDPTAQRLEDAAQRLGVTAEDLLRISIEEKLSRLEGTFHDTADYVISKNKEL